jgi:16S rRNA (adenine1518-N6/adenine1519-N6)-dimethyltransferase
MTKHRQKPHSQSPSDVTGDAVHAKKSLGQNFLFDTASLRAIVDAASILRGDQVLEIGPGLGHLTAEILSRGATVTSVEFDADLATELPRRVAKLLRERADQSADFARAPRLICEPDLPAWQNLRVTNADFLQFDLNQIKPPYKIVANIPYYITSPIIERILAADNLPAIVVLLIQKEVAERIAAKPGQMSVLAVSTQLRAQVSLGPIITKDKFTPAPKVDSQVIILRPREYFADPDFNQTQFLRVVKAGFAEKRKKLKTALAGGLHVEKSVAENRLKQAGISPDARAQDLNLDDWRALTHEFVTLIN